jgi:hypothetical protein
MRARAGDERLQVALAALHEDRRRALERRHGAASSSAADAAQRRLLDALQLKNELERTMQRIELSSAHSLGGSNLEPRARAKAAKLLEC